MQIGYIESQHKLGDVPGALRGHALALLRSLASGCTRLVFWDPQHRETLDRLEYGNEGARQRGLIVDPAAGSFVVMKAAHRLGQVRWLRYRLRPADRGEARK
jgi:hypothetical protein